MHDNAQRSRSQLMLEARTIAAGVRAGYTLDDYAHSRAALEDLIRKFTREVRSADSAGSIVATLKEYGAMINAIGTYVGWAIDDVASFERDIVRQRYVEEQIELAGKVEAERYRLTGHEENPV